MLMNAIGSFSLPARSLAKLGAAVGLVLAMAACASLETAAPPVDKLALPKNADHAKLAEGRQILAEHCVKCHGAPQIAKHSAQDWSEDILPKMTKKAKLNPHEAELVKNYVLTARGTMPHA
jgi:mono/diheme cytochrome c family protein